MRPLNQRDLMKKKIAILIMLLTGNIAGAHAVQLSRFQSQQLPAEKDWSFNCDLRLGDFD